MLPYPDIDPVIFHLGPLQVRWYGLMYVFGFLAAYHLVRHQIRKFDTKYLVDHFENLNFVLLLGMIFGGRLGYIVFYNLDYYLAHPGEIAATWLGGMSFHGALIGLLLGGIIFCWRYRLDFWQTADLYVAAGPVGIGLGRIGNFINGELFGRVTDVPWAMVFPGGGSLPRHPSQIYECLLEGVLLFLILWRLKEKRWPSGSMLAVFLICYGLLRSFAELFREPDPQLGFLFASLTMGQLLSVVMIVGGCALLFLRWRREGATLTA